VFASCVTPSHPISVLVSVSGDYKQALHYCFLVAGYLQLVLSDVPQHPLLGLQLFTLGDLLASQAGREEEARVALAMSRDVLRCSLGPASDMMLRLEASMREVSHSGTH
jgi:hypothetical protein